MQGVRTDATSDLSGLMFKMGDLDQWVGSSFPSGDSGTQAPSLWLRHFQYVVSKDS